MTGAVALRGMEFFAHHGYHAEERRIGNKYSVDVILTLDVSAAAKEDELSGTVDYERVYQVISEIMNLKARLLEHLAGQVIDELKKEFPKVQKIQVTVNKHNPPIKGLCEVASVTLEG